MVKLFLNRRRNLNGTSAELIARLLEVVGECFTTHKYLSLFDDMNIPSHHVDTHFQSIQGNDTHFQFIQGNDPRSSSLGILLTNYRVAFLSQPDLGAIYVSEIEVSRLYQEVVMEGVTDPAKRALVFASMAIGKLNCSKSSRSSPTTSNDTGGNSHYQEALLAVEKMFVARPSILVFKALLTTSISDAFIDHNPLTDCDKTGTTSTSRDFHAHCRLSQLCSRMSEDLHMAGDARDPNSVTKVSDRAEKWIVVLQRFNTEVLETKVWADHLFAWTSNSTHPDTSKSSCPVSSYPSKLFLFEMALFAYGRLFQRAGMDISLDKSEHIIAQFASEVLNVIINMDPSTTKSTFVMAANTPKQSTPFSVSGKTAIVTGAGSGINFSFAELLLKRGCNVVIADLALRPEAEELVSKHNSNPRAIFVKIDVTSWPALSKMFDATLAEFGNFDILCPGAGVYEPHWSNFWHPPGSSESKDSVDGGHYKLLDINITHPIRATQLAISYWLHPREVTDAKLPPAVKASPGNPKRIIHISSVAGQVPNINAPLYSASKFAITGFVRSLARLEETDGVRINAVAPGVVRTPLWTEHPEKLINLDESQDGWVTPEEVAEAMLRCAEDDGVPGGSILEVGKNNTRLVQTFNDPGPERDPKKGLMARNVLNGTEMVFTWLKDATKWAVGRD
ncbi:short chain dehydrogenase [Colletotrichum asianum]